MAAERDDPGSSLSVARELSARRRATRDLLEAAYEPLEAPSGVWAYRRGSAAVALNLTDEPRTLQGHELAPWTGVLRDV